MLDEMNLMRIFGKEWTELANGSIDELWTLERESAIYGDHWEGKSEIPVKSGYPSRCGSPPFQNG